MECDHARAHIAHDGRISDGNFIPRKKTLNPNARGRHSNTVVEERVDT